MGNAELDGVLGATSSFVGRWRTAPASALEHVSDSVKDLLGYSPEELCSMADPVSILLHPEDQEAVRGTPVDRRVDVELRLVRRDGEVRWFELRLAPVPGDGAV